MIKFLTKHGNSYALVVDRPIMELLNIRPDTPLEIRTDGKSLVITPESEASRDERVRQAAAWVNQKYAKALKKLAE